MPLLFSAGRRLLRTPCADARWSSYNAGHGVEFNDEETMAERVDHYGRAEGHCIVVSQTPVKSKNTASGRDFYAEIKMETDSDSWSSGMDMGFTLLEPDVVGKANEQGLCWADFPDTWVFRGDGMLRINGRAYPPGALPGQCAVMEGWNTATLEWGDTCGLQIRNGGSEIVGYQNGKEVGCLKLDETIKVPTERELYLICDVIGRAGEVEILDVDVPGAEVAAAAAPAPGGAAPASNAFLDIMQRRPPMHR